MLDDAIKKSQPENKVKALFKMLEQERQKAHAQSRSFQDRAIKDFGGSYG